VDEKGEAMIADVDRIYLEAIAAIDEFLLPARSFNR
jgi:hypothetical protein